MFKKTLILSMLIGTSLFSQIKKISKFSDIDRSLFNKENVIFIFDVDWVLSKSAEPAFQYKNMVKHRSVAKAIMKDFTIEQKDKFLSLMATTTRSELVEKEILTFIQSIKNKNIPVVALTAICCKGDDTKCIKSWRYEQLKELGIDFSDTTILDNKTFSYYPEYLGCKPCYYNGIVFSNGSLPDNEKGKVLISFLEKANLKVRNVVFLDDRKSNLESAEKMLRANYPKSAFYGYLYEGIKKGNSQAISKQEFTAKWQTLADRVKNTIEPKK